MKTRIVKLFYIASAAVLFAAGSASRAQAEDRVVAKVPFDFMVGTVRLPAGTYTVRTAGDDPAVVAIVSNDGRHAAYVLTIPAGTLVTSVQSPELVFQRFENQYFLSRIVDDTSDQREIPLTPRIMQQELAAEHAEH